MTDDSKRGSVSIDFEGPGDMLVEIIRQLFQRGGTVIATGILEKLFSGDKTVEEILWTINQRGLDLKMYAVVECPGRTGDKGEIDPPVSLAAAENTISVKPGMLKTTEVEPAENSAEDDGGDPPDNVRKLH